MTFEEAKKVFLDRGLVYVEGGAIIDGEKWREACYVISQWLKQQPCEDAISRRAAIKLGYDLSQIDGEHYVQSWQVVDVADIRRLPRVTPQPKIGHWNITEIFQGGIKETWYECSECEWSNALVIPRNYCPNCGAKMESEDEE